VVLTRHLSTQSEEFWNIITICLPANSSHLIHPLDVGCFSVLKRMYGRELEAFIKAHINHITKTELFIAFKAAHFNTMTIENIQAGFRGAGLIPHDPQAVISKRDVKLRTPTPTEPPSRDADAWVSQTPSNPKEAISQSEHVKGRIARHQGSSPNAIFSAVKQLAKGTELIAHEITLLREEVRVLRQANQALAKRRKAKRTRLQVRRALNVRDAQVLIARKKIVGRQLDKKSERGLSEVGSSTSRRCGRCGKTGHNIRTCQEAKEMSE
jgi:hypothetical protein